MRNPNGYGSVYKLKGNRRRPWTARKVIGWNEKGHPIYMFVGYWATRKEAIDGLAKYNAQPFDRRATFGECAEAWWEEDAHKLRPSTVRSYAAARERCKPLYKMKIADIRLQDMQQLVNDVTTAVGTSIKLFIARAFEYAIRHEILPPERISSVRYIKVSDNTGRVIKRQNFTSQEVSKVTDPYVLILLYTGLRANEFRNLKAEDIHLEERWLFVRESKTKAGVRIVPIAERIVPCFASMPYPHSYDKLKKDMQKNYGHSPHDARHTFISMCADKGIDERIIKAIVGHTGTDITETVYTHIDLELLKNAVNSL